QLTHLKHYYQQPKFIQYSTNKLNQTLPQIPQHQHKHTLLLLSAHTFPKALIQNNNHPYPQQLQHTPLLIKQQSNIQHIPIGCQSQRNTPTPCLGP
ncbi:ferrochelatase, partial [Staphylococcus aureus]|uniref:ferrochelatase n=1 Tax=Staphylococcus aureus TaxID=1280 RepID=UPI001642EAD4